MSILGPDCPCLESVEEACNCCRLETRLSAKPVRVVEPDEEDEAHEEGDDSETDFDLTSWRPGSAFTLPRAEDEASSLLPDPKFDFGYSAPAAGSTSRSETLIPAFPPAVPTAPASPPPPVHLPQTSASVTPRSHRSGLLHRVWTRLAAAVKGRR